MAKKNVVLLCEGGQQYGVVVEELSVHKVIKQIIADLTNPSKQFLCFGTYVPFKDPNQEMWIKASIVNAIVVMDIKTQSNLALPNKNIIGSAGDRLN